MNDDDFMEVILLFDYEGNYKDDDDDDDDDGDDGVRTEYLRNEYL